MSMSQEEIESLMSGIDGVEESEDTENDIVEEVSVNTDEIEELISQSENLNIKEDIETPVVEPESTENLDVIENKEEVSIEGTVSSDDIDELLKDTETNDITTQEESSKGLESNDIVTSVEPKEEIDGLENVEKKIDEGIFPLPAEKDTKVVSQLTEVANDSEEKVGQIFDVLSLTLDNNSTVRNSIKDFENFALSQTKLLESLSNKFPNIEVFKSSLSELKNVSENLQSLNDTLNDEDNQIFSAMELMQFNDINRQKIERVMAVIRKLSLYLNNLFEDDGDRNVAVAKHIHGDHSEDLIGEDLDKLIDEFNNN